MEDDGFQLVSRKKSARAPTRSLHGQLHGGYEGVTTAELLIRINDLKQKLRDHQFFKDAIATIESTLELRPTEILCYGIGRLGSCRITQTQFAMLLLIKEHFQVTGLLYDPVLQEEEISAIEQSSLSVLPYNEGCKRHLTHPTIVYMLHCAQSMYNNLLWANWNKTSLSHVILIGNKLSSYHEREVSIANTYEDHVIFNDTAVHVFPRQQLDASPASVWQDCVEPSPDCSDNEIIL